MARLDHVIFAVRDLETAAARLFEEHGLEAQPGGVHGDAGTGNMYVPLGNEQYVELLAVTNPSSRHPMVRALQRILVEGDRLYNFAVTSEDIESEANRLNESIFDVETALGDGSRVAFRLTGVSGVVGQEVLPFFVQTPGGRDWIGRLRPPRHRMTPLGVSRVEYGGRGENISRRINDPQFPIQITSGRPGLAAIWIKTAQQDIELRA